MPTDPGPVTPSAIRVRLLGPPRIERDGQAATVDTRKAIALLAYLALSRRPPTRDELAALLWPASDHVRARSALRRTLSSLGSALGRKALVVDGQTLALDATAVWVDVWEFRRSSEGCGAHALDAACAACVSSVRSAVDLAHADFLAGFSLRDSASFDEWQLNVADGLRRELSADHEWLAETLAPTDVVAALRHARRWLELDTLHEPAHRALMRLHASRGDRASALRQYRECVAVLARELGVGPLEETTELYEAILERAPSPLPAPETQAVRGQEPLAETPFVGREAELSALAELYASIGADGRLAVVGGEPGIGKTRLATEFLETVRGRGAPVITARCHPDEERLAFGTVVELLRAAMEAPGLGTAPARALAEAARLLPELAPAAADTARLDTPAGRRRLFDSVAEILDAACSGPSPGVLFVDDVHWIDPSSSDVLRFYVRRLRGRGSLVLLTWREVPQAHPLRRMLSQAAREGLATGISLERLSPAEVRQIVRATGAGDEELAETLYRESAGVPFFCTEFLAAAAGPGGLPAGVRDLLASRVGAVGGKSSQVLTAAAVIGRPFDPDTVREVSGRSPDEVADALEELCAHGLVVESDNRYDLSHPKLREYTYEGATHARRRLLHGRAADTYAVEARLRPELAAVAARHCEHAGRETDAASFYAQAGDHARGVFANAEALAHYRSALALGHPEPAALHEAAGDLQTFEGRYRDALTSYETAAALGASVASIERKIGGVHHRLGEWEVAEAHYIDALEALGQTSDALGLRARILGDRSLNAHRRGSEEEAEASAEQALIDAEAAGDERALAQGRNIAGVLASHRGDPGAAREHLEASLALAEGLDDPAAAAAALNNLALVLRSGDPVVALEHAERALELCIKVGDRHREAALHSNVADLLRAAGRTEEAMEHLKSSAAIFADVGEPDELHPEIWKLVEW